MFVTSSHRIEDPFFSICIPQYNRTSFLIEALKVFAGQSFKNFEVCISDDCSTDNKQDELISFLQSSGLSFIYQCQIKNLRYDGNIRASIALARGQYCFLSGNDDCLASSDTLAILYEEISRHESVGAVVTNYQDWETGEKNWRIRKSGLVGSGPEVAVSHFRNQSFVTGVLVKRKEAQDYATDRWDGSEMYQMFVTSRIIASGYSLLELDLFAVRKDIKIADEDVDSYAKKPKIHPCPIIERKIPVTIIGQVVADGVEPHLHYENRSKFLEKIFLQLYLFTYPFWLIEYKYVQSWNYAFGLWLGFHPRNVLGSNKFTPLSLFRLYLCYYFCGFGLLFPKLLFDQARPLLYRLSKRAFSSS